MAITCDGWTSRATESFVTITAHIIKEDWQLVSYVLQTRSMEESHTGENLAKLLGEAAEEWGISDKDIVIVTDEITPATWCWQPKKVTSYTLGATPTLPTLPHRKP